MDDRFEEFQRSVSKLDQQQLLLTLQTVFEDNQRLRQKLAHSDRRLKYLLKANMERQTGAEERLRGVRNALHHLRETLDAAFSVFPSFTKIFLS